MTLKSDDFVLDSPINGSFALSDKPASELEAGM